MTGDSVETFPETEVGSGKEQRKLKGGAEKLGAKWVLWWWPIFTWSTTWFGGGGCRDIVKVL